MINIKAIATATDGSVKRMATTYDVINDEGKVISSNAKLNRVVIDQAALKAIDTLEQLAQESIKTALSNNAEN
jgi:major membrane immunogen (membrane-anchored lipoprotein)